MSKASGQIDRLVKTRELCATQDPSIDKPIMRKSTPQGITDFDEMQGVIGELLRQAREVTGLTRGELASLVGLNPVVYGRYEKAVSHMTVVRLIHMCELLGISPDQLTAEIAPHVYGRTPDEARDYVRLMDMISKLPADAVSDLREFVSRITPEQRATVSG